MINRRSPEDMLVEGMVVGPSAMIIGQEAEGARSMVVNDVLPRQGTIERHMFDELSKEQIESLGFVLGEPRDRLFINATFPPGWTKMPSGHNLYTYLLDEQGRQRATIMYKAAFYDEDAWISWRQRFQIGQDYIYADNDPEHNNRPVATRITIIDNGEQTKVVGEMKGKIITTYPDRPHYSVAINRGEAIELSDKDMNDAKAWLEERYPDYKNSFPYWNDPIVEPDAHPLG